MNISLIRETNKIYNTTQNIIICIEEISELIEQLTKKEKDIDHLAEEVCDVLICIKRLEVMLGIRLSNTMYIKFNKFESIKHLSLMQKSLSKFYRNKFIYNKVFTENLECTKATLRSIIRYYHINDNVNEWIIKKEERTRYRIDNKILK